MYKFLKNIPIILTLLGACSSPSVGLELFNRDTYMDIGTDANGKPYLRDTQKNWEIFTQDVDFRIKSEIEGRRPEGGAESWVEFWQWLIRNNQTGQENKEKYINYIINTRRENGLPELKEVTAPSI